METENTNLDTNESTSLSFNGDSSILEEVLKKTNDFSAYLDILSEIKNDYLIIFSIKDTPGNCLHSSMINKIRDLGFTNLSKELWKMYVGVSFGEEVLCDKCGSVAEEAVVFSCKTSTFDVDISVSSMSWRQGNKSEIIIDGKDYSTNYRGINIAVYDAKSKRIVDSIAFDNHEMRSKFIRKPRIVGIDYKAEFFKGLYSRPIILFGGGKTATEFYNKYQGKLDIYQVLTDSDIEANKTIGKLKVEKFRMQNIPKNALIIICRERTADYDNVKKLLSANGMTILQNYLNYNLIDSILSGKKVTVFLGFCQMLGIMQVMNHCKTFTDKYYAKHFHIGRNTKAKDYNFDEFEAHVKLADLLCVVNTWSDSKLIHLDIENELPKNCQKITLPKVSFRGFAPYLSNEIKKINYDGMVFHQLRYPFLYEQDLFNRLIKEGKSTDEIYEIVSNENLYTENEVVKNFKLGLKYIQIESDKSDIKIYDFINENVKKIRLYRDGLHYENALFYEFAERLAKYLGLDCHDEIQKFSEYCSETNLPLQLATEIPILPSVAKHLGIENLALPDQKYELKLNDNDDRKYVTFKEWVYSYVDYTRCAMRINEIMSVDGGQTV